LAREALGRRLLPLDRSLDIHICKLRHKLWPDERGLERIKTVRGVGYIFVWDE
jgi:two-component system response regulator CpxR